VPLPTFTPKVWEDRPSTATPIDAAGLVDLETRLATFATDVGTAVVIKDPATAARNTVEPSVDVPSLTLKGVAAGNSEPILKLHSQGATNYYARMIELHNDAYNATYRIASTGHMVQFSLSGGGSSLDVGSGYTAGGSLGALAVRVNTVFAGNVGLQVKGSASQTGNLQEWRSSADAVLARVASSGAIFTASSVAAGGSTNGSGFTIAAANTVGVDSNAGGFYIGGDGTTGLTRAASKILKVIGSGGGIRLTSPDGLTEGTISLDNEGNLTLEGTPLVKSADVDTIDVLTQTAYDALGTPDTETLYVIDG
jgi:hypothetical protein